MIIVCPECATKYDIKAEQIPDGGLKVRCARCKTVFSAEQPLPAEPQSAPEQTVAEADTASDDLLADAFAETDTLENDFNYEEFQQLDEEEEEDDVFIFDSAASAKDEAESPVAAQPASEDTDDFADSFDIEEDASDEPLIEAAAEEDDMPVETEVGEKKKGGGSLMKILLLLILLVLIAAGAYIYLGGAGNLLGQNDTRPVEQTGRITLADLEGKFIQNEQAGELFLIRGNAVNEFNKPRAAVQVKGVLFDPTGKPLLQKTVFCGNPISDSELQSLNFAELEELMGNQFGKDLSNMKVNKGQAIPFAIVFKDLPKNISEFSVIVAASKPASS
ncbi:MAG: hypothetical protein C0622_06510 [Desulfuromonas sp.]|nr:MAG: hypothetical protein C0622_06510 [Desulfuromonas sp.]